MVSYIRVEEFPGVVQANQKYIERWREAIEVKMKLNQSEAYQ